MSRLENSTNPTFLNLIEDPLHRKESMFFKGIRDLFRIGIGENFEVADHMHLVEIVAFMRHLRPGNVGARFFHQPGPCKTHQPAVKLRRNAHPVLKDPFKLAVAHACALYKRIDLCHPARP